MFDVDLFLNGWKEYQHERVTALRPLFNGNRPIYLLGYNDYSKKISSMITIDGFVDDVNDYDKSPLKNQIIKSSSLPKDAILINCVLNAKPITASRSIKHSKAEYVISIADLSECFPEKFPQPDFVKESRKDFAENREKWNFVKSRLSDKDSSRVLEDIFKYRITADYNFMSGYTFRPDEQYFEQFIPVSCRKIFVDAGAFNGETSQLFSEWNPDYQKIFLFEPSKYNMHKAKNALNHLKNITFISKGVSSAEGTLFFNPELGSASQVVESGGESVDVTTIDSSIDGEVTFIKMDLEGWELEALKGAENKIKNYHPALAVAVYHHPSHFREVMDFVLSVRNDYDVRLRHYTESWTETIMYFIPA